jgi:hypothetical protein
MYRIRKVVNQLFNLINFLKGKSAKNLVYCTLKNTYVFPFVFIFLTGCYSFKGLSIDPNVKTFYLTSFENKTSIAPPVLAQEFSEKMRRKIREEVRLKSNEETPDLEFSGAITEYRVTTEAPKPGEGSSVNVLEMIVNVNFVNHQNEKLNYKKDFSFKVRYPGDRELISLQDDLNKQLVNRISSDIINDTFNNW